MKMADSLRSACVLFSETQEHFDVIGGTEEPVELISSNNAGGDLAIYDLSATFSTSGVSINSAFYSVSFILGTVQGGINIKAAGNFCNPPNGYDSSFDYCAINKFNFAAQATGE